MTKDFYTVRDIAEQLQVKEKAVRRLITTGELDAGKVLGKWVVTADELRAFIDLKTRRDKNKETRQAGTE